MHARVCVRTFKWPKWYRHPFEVVKKSVHCDCCIPNRPHANWPLKISTLQRFPRQLVPLGYKAEEKHRWQAFFKNKCSLQLGKPPHVRQCCLDLFAGLTQGFACNAHRLCLHDNGGGDILRHLGDPAPARHYHVDLELKFT